MLKDYGAKLSNEALNSTTHEPVVPARACGSWSAMNDCDGNSGGLQKRQTSRCRLNSDDLVEDEEEHMLSLMQYHISASMTECREDCGSTTSSGNFLHWKVLAFPVTLDSLLMLSWILFPDDSRKGMVTIHIFEEDHVMGIVLGDMLNIHIVLSSASEIPDT